MLVDHPSILTNFASHAKFQLTFGGRVTSGTFEEVFAGYRSVMKAVHPRLDVLAVSGNTLITKYNFHAEFKDGCHAMFSGADEIEFDDNGHLVKHNCYSDDRTDQELKQCLSHFPLPKA